MLPTEEITVYGDRYARWDDTRWHVQSEVTFPDGLELGGASAWQLELVLHCQKGEPQLWEGIEVMCALQDVSLRAASPANARVDRLLANLEESLRGASVQLQVSPLGTVPDLDLEGVISRNSTQRQSQETLRQLLSLAMAGFALPIPEQTPTTWLEYHSALMDLPSPTASRGSSELVHHATVSEGHRLVSSQGRGTTALPTPGSIGGETMFSMVASASASIRLSDGVMTARRWTIEGHPSPSSGWTEPCILSGSLRLLEPAER